MKWFLLLGFLMFFGHLVIWLINDLASGFRKATKADIEWFGGDVEG